MEQGDISQPVTQGSPRWKIILADDEKEVHTVSRLVLDPLSYHGKKCSLLSAFSAGETIELLNSHPDTAVVILDLVMENPDAGFEVARYIRQTMNELRIRILMRTGYPLSCSPGDVLQHYGINQIMSKTSCTSQILTNQIISLLHEYETDNRQYTTSLIRRLVSEKHINSRLSSEHSDVKKVLNTAGIGTWRFELEKGIIHMNPHGIEKSFPVPHVRLQDLYDVMSSVDRERLNESFMNHLEGMAEYFEGEFTLSSFRDIRWNIRGKLDLSTSTPILTGVYWNGKTVRQAAGEPENIHYQHILEGIPDAVFNADGHGIITYVNSAVHVLTGMEPGSLAGKHFSLLLGSGWKEMMPDRNGLFPSCRIEFPIRHGDGSLRWLEGNLSFTGKKDGEGSFHGTFRDITRRKETEDHWKHMAFHDTLTGLPNRLLLKEKLDHVLALARRHDNRVAVLFIDLDDFKKVNDSMGHDTGDELLRGVSGMLQSRIREIDTVARYGGDEFVIILDTYGEQSGLDAIIERIMSGFDEPVMTGKGPILVTASMGIAIYPDNGTEALTLISMADGALYQAKNTGKKHYTFSSSPG